ncbi:hypothetical protein LJE86_12510 [bacterium BMS3Abin03]|nr:hypothetical protein [bacterium BMS3Abin03]MCG6961471.1 hypothetical protein [bacterium BMS3Abin03]
MPKYEALINDLSSIESQITILKSQYTDSVGRIKELETALEKSKQDNTSLYDKIASLEEEITYLKNKAEKGLQIENQESLKVRLQDLISRIDFHLSTDRQA